MPLIHVNDSVFLDKAGAAASAQRARFSPAPAPIVRSEPAIAKTEMAVIKSEPKSANTAWTRIVIRMLDICVSLAALLFFSPILVLVGCLVWLQDGGPIFYGQRRIGLNGREFMCFKFRSMVTNSSERLKQYLAENPEARAEWAKDHKLKNDPRITGWGRFIRKTSLDEFPQLWNVLKGDMSLVGPRPIVQDEVIKYGYSFSKYTSVKPGITGLWQVAGRNDVTYSRRVAMDRFFSKRRSVTFYLFILVMTVPAVLRQRGSY